MKDEKELIKRCLKNDSGAQYELYQKYSPVMYGVCIRFSQYNIEADDILQEGFIKVFQNLKSFKFKGSFEGWIRRIVVNTAINYLKKHGIYYADVDLANIGETNITEDEATSRLNEEEINKLIQKLPEGKRVIFNLYVFEGYSHKQIAKSLGISISTSKSQLAKAKKILQTKIIKNKISHYE